MKAQHFVSLMGVKNAGKDADALKALKYHRRQMAGCSCGLFDSSLVCHSFPPFCLAAPLRELLSVVVV